MDRARRRRGRDVACRGRGAARGRAPRPRLTGTPRPSWSARRLRVRRRRLGGRGGEPSRAGLDHAARHRAPLRTGAVRRPALAVVVLVALILTVDSGWAGEEAAAEPPVAEPVEPPADTQEGADVELETPDSIA